MKNGLNQVIITNPQKVIFPEQGITKGQLVAYYRQVAPFMLPFLKNRPVMLHRFSGKNYSKKTCMPNYLP